MTRKDYVAIAAAIRKEVIYSGSETTTALKSVADSIADIMKRDNPRFDRSRFIDACGFGA